MHATVWDPTTLHQMVGDNGAMYRRMLDLFLRDTATRVRAIESAAACGELAQVANVAHDLKSAARMVGALQMGQLCDDIEATALAGQGADNRVLVGRLDAIYSSAQEKIVAHMAAVD